MYVRSVVRCCRSCLFVAVYHTLLPIGFAQAWLAGQIRRAGIELGWPLLIVWWPLRQIYTAGFRLCVTLRPDAPALTAINRGPHAASR